MGNLREAQKAMTRDLLLQSGLEVFTRKGYAAATIDDIAKAAGATRTTFYLHFASKAELVSQLVDRAHEMLASLEGPSLSDVVESGERAKIRAWLESRMSQWDTIKPYMIVSYQASHEPDVAERTEDWYEQVVQQMATGLNRVGRFDSERRRVRSILAFGEFEYLSRRYFAVGWRNDRQRETCLDELTGSWLHLLTE